MLDLFNRCDPHQILFMPMHHLGPSAITLIRASMVFMGRKHTQRLSIQARFGTQMGSHWLGR